VTAAPSTSGSADDSASPEASGRPGAPRVVATLAEGFAVPWGIDFLPDGSAVVTERDSTRVPRIDAEGGVEEIGTIRAAAPEGEGGLLGVAVSPSYADDGLLFFYLTTDEDNRVVRATYDSAAGLGEPEVVLDGIPNGVIHDGGRLAFGPVGYLYVSTGETGECSLAQDGDSLGG
jgi:glucose/arabinose dehydrogenase